MFWYCIERYLISMSQSDYLKRKRLATTLHNDSTRMPIFDAQMLVDFKQFSLENTIVSDSNPLNRILPANKQLIFHIETGVSSCPPFIVCSGTQSRPNRVPHTGKMCTPVPLNWHEKNAIDNAKQLWCKCTLNGDRCACVRGH